MLPEVLPNRGMQAYFEIRLGYLDRFSLRNVVNLQALGIPGTFVLQQENKESPYSNNMIAGSVSIQMSGRKCAV